MSTKHVGKLVLGLAVMFAATSLVPQPVSAQSRINSKVDRNNGRGFWANERASRNIQHARNYSRSIQRYTTQAPMIQPQVTQAESQLLGNQIQSIQREMVVIRDQSADNPQVVQQVKAIETKLSQAADTHEMLHAECCKDSPDGKVCGEMASKITTTLDQVSKDHSKLMKTMGQEDAAHDHDAMPHDHAASDDQTPAKSGQ